MSYQYYNIFIEINMVNIKSHYQSSSLFSFLLQRGNRFPYSGA